MAKFSLCIFTTTVLLSGTAAFLICLLEAKNPVIPENFMIDPIRACWNIEAKFNRARQKLKECLGLEIDISKLESLYHEFCAPNSDFRKKVERQTFCISLNIHKLMDCTSKLKKSPNLPPFKFQEINDACQSFSEDMSKCYTNKVGGPCGAEGMEVYGRIAEVSEPFHTGTCLAIAKHAFSERDFLAETAEVEQKDVETSLAESEQNQGYTASAATEHSAVTWCILMGLLYVAKWW